MCTSDCSELTHLCLLNLGPDELNVLIPYYIPAVVQDNSMRAARMVGEIQQPSWLS